MTIIIIITIILFVVLISWTIHNLGQIDKIKKLIFIVISLLVVSLITLLIFNLSSKNIIYEKQEMIGNVKTILMMVFIPFNGLIFIPYIAKITSKLEDGEIDKQKVKKNIIILLILFIILMIWECNYLKSAQQGIIEIYQTMSKEEQ